MIKTYWIGDATVDDPPIFAKYGNANTVAFGKYNGQFPVRGGSQKIKEGRRGEATHRGDRVPFTQSGFGVS